MGDVQNVNALCATDLSGVWQGNDGGTYYIQQNKEKNYLGQDIEKIWWAGGSSFEKGLGFSNVFDGQRTGDNIQGSWADVPLGVNRANGDLTLQCNQDANNDILTRTSATGGFGGSEWLKPKDILKKSFSWGNLNMGDCHLTAAYLNLFSNGRGNWHADITSESDDDSWVVSKITITDINGNPVFTIPKFFSPTLTQGPLPFAYGSKLEEDKIRWWNYENIQFPFESFDKIAHVSLISSC
ncbi:DUF6294 family protein [Candidatus Nitrosocosmicus agrestis]|jgi:hypothetical protein|uniref:DUF6294 family protein n=1 Tax=Candidatus Nitrosocosmicus agrestis TaxID=2563600 RepID=UPI00122E76FC|nr:DUF6294 family protein [Candidatus Nitrosocosmicus sp. SS]KAA2282484.1 hypothetical protein F1Z66_06270 [Candidatus Nitrosocosmicus sp. SS]KAF0868750.1 hypothetical protein E5N71_08705 [Candidatus Nitrosocosmicus sp. SS]MDR4489661.1 DUF6294 family protein [Candidatus Nitrosocosmicus sp.]